MSDGVTQPSYKDTLNLPRTDFPIHPKRAVEEPAMLERWDKEQLAARSFICNEGAPKFILHDGPPYTNGHIHLGHAYNKILKDILTKSRRMAGMHVPVQPGWDCHGLPIEHKVVQENPGLTGAALIAKCREYSEHWMRIQREEFKKLGVLMDWDRPYLTMARQFEAAVVRAFGQFVAKGFIENKSKTVPWCPSCQTVLATAEIEYKDRKDPSVYVCFPLEQKDAQELLGEPTELPISLLVWTTTPWTIPLNRAVVLRPETSYSICKANDRLVIVGTALVQKLSEHLITPFEEIKRFPAEALSGKKVHHPLIAAQMSPVLLDQMVSIEDGTACLHNAPGCGPDDYDLGVRNGLEIYSPISTSGHYTKGIEPVELEGKSVADGQGWVITKLLENGNLFHKASIKHSYPHCWRCRNGLIFRATKQWFCNLEANSLRERTLIELQENISFLPKSSSNSLRAMVDGRLEWCLSRQRAWGVPIPAIRCVECNDSQLHPVIFDAAIEGIEREGVEYWRKIDLTSLLPRDARCSQCGGTSFEKEYDILDVWFESGVTHYAVLRANSSLSYPADVYLEGRDQARGWFQSSLLTSMVLEGRSCVKTIVTHGYTVDAQGQKMSKSLGNGVEAQEIINKVGTDGLRLWVASIDYENDAVVSDTLLNNVSEVQRKIRNTLRFLISNLYDFNPAKDAVPVEKLPYIDRFALNSLTHIERKIREAYDETNFTAVNHMLAYYCSTELSALYLDIIKDRLYVERADGFERRSAQTVCYHILNVLTTLIAPIMSFTAEQISDLYQTNKDRSIHLQSFATIVPLWERVAKDWDEEGWGLVLSMRLAILKAIERLREQSIIKHPLEASLKIGIDSSNTEGAQLLALFNKMQRDGQDPLACMKELCIVSYFELVPYDSIAQQVQSDFMGGIAIAVERAQGVKCPRCWQYHMNGEGLCHRCDAIVKSIRG